MKAFFRLLSLLALGGAVFVGVFDAIRSVSTGRIDVMSALAAWVAVFPASSAFVKGAVAHYLHPEVWRWIEAGLAATPAFAALLLLSLLCWVAGYRRRISASPFSSKSP